MGMYIKGALVHWFLLVFVFDPPVCFYMRVWRWNAMSEEVFLTMTCTSSFVRLAYWLADESCWQSWGVLHIKHGFSWKKIKDIKVRTPQTWDLVFFVVLCSFSPLGPNQNISHFKPQAPGPRPISRGPGSGDPPEGSVTARGAHVDLGPVPLGHWCVGRVGGVSVQV